MKTLREVLFERHRAAEPRLNSVRHEVLEQLNNKETKQQSAGLNSLLLRCCHAFWNELILPARRIWVGFACAWIVIALVNLAGSTDSTGLQAKRSSPPINMALAWQQQQKFLAELNNPEPAPARNSKHTPPKPRSDCLSPIRPA